MFPTMGIQRYLDMQETIAKAIQLWDNQVKPDREAMASPV
jgi:hypothetical protein